MPSLVAAYSVDPGTSDTNPLVTGSFTPAPDEVLLVKASADRGDTVPFDDPTANGLTFTVLERDESANHNRVGLWVATVPPEGVGSITVTLDAPGATPTVHSMVVERWSEARAGAVPTSVLATGAASAPQTTITTVGDGSVVSWLNSDWNAVDGSARTYDTTSDTPTEVAYHFHGAGLAEVSYYAYQDAAAAGVQTFGLTAPGGQNWTLVGVELLAPPAGPAGGNRSRILTRGMPLRSGGA